MPLPFHRTLCRRILPRPYNPLPPPTLQMHLYYTLQHLARLPLHLQSFQSQWDYIASLCPSTLPRASWEATLEVRVPCCDVLCVLQ